jgi:hypothetical protein
MLLPSLMDLIVCAGLLPTAGDANEMLGANALHKIVIAIENKNAIG